MQATDLRDGDNLSNSAWHDRAWVGTILVTLGELPKTHWAWSLPLTVLTVVIHICGLALIGGKFVTVLGASLDDRSFIPKFAVVIGGARAAPHCAQNFASGAFGERISDTPDGAASRTDCRTSRLQRCRFRTSCNALPYPITKATGAFIIKRSPGSRRAAERRSQYVLAVPATDCARMIDPLVLCAIRYSCRIKTRRVF